MPDDRNERLQQLKAQALRTLQSLPPALNQAEAGAGADTHKLLEDLRVYQIELELQNEELRLAQQQAALAGSRLQQMFDRLPVPAFVVDRHGLVLESNDVARQWLGAAKSSMAQDFRLVHGVRRADRPRLLTALADAHTDQPERVVGLHLTDADGTTRLVDAQVMRLPQNFHADARFNVLLLDRSAEAARETDRQLFQTVMDSSDDLIYATDASGRCLMANQATLGVIGLAREQVLGRRREDVLPLRDAILQDAADHKVRQTGCPLSTQESLQTPAQSEPRVFTTRRFPLRDAQGQVWGVGGISRDVTVEHLAQQHLRLSERAFVHTSQAIIITDPNTRMLRVNPGFCLMSGFSEATALGQRTSILRSGRQDVGFYRTMWAALNTDGRWAGEITNRRADGRYYTVWSCIDALRDEQGEHLGYVAVQTDLTALHEHQAAIERLASTDPLTGLPNRALLMDRLGQLLAFSQRQRTAFAVLFADLDRFKQVNDALGHRAGDQLLQAVAQRLQTGLRGQDTAARLGGDEFVALLPATELGDALHLAHKLLDTLTRPIELPGLAAYQPGLSMGLAVFPGDGDTAEQLLHNADTAMYAAKLAGRQRVLAYSRDMQTEQAKLFAIEVEMHRALAQAQLRLCFQPRFGLSDLRVRGGQALLRWDRPGHGLCEPAQFLPWAEKAGLAREFDQWLMNEATAQLARWRDTGRWPDDWRLSIGQTSHSLGHPGGAARWLERLKDMRLPPQLIALELTEAALLPPSAELSQALQTLHSGGITLVVANFGTGHASLSHLQSLPPGALKIDERFVQDMEVSESDRVLVEAMVELGHKLGHQLWAQGVETEGQRALLHRLGCDAAHGWLLQGTVPASTFEELYLAPA